MEFLKTKIKTKKDIKNYIDDLYSSGLLYHFDDNARDIPEFVRTLSNEQLDLLDKRTDEMLSVDYDYAFDYACNLLNI